MPRNPRWTIYNYPEDLSKLNEEELAYITRKLKRKIAKIEEKIEKGANSAYYIELNRKKQVKELEERLEKFEEAWQGT